MLTDFKGDGMICHPKGIQKSISNSKIRLKPQNIDQVPILKPVNNGFSMIHHSNRTFYNIFYWSQGCTPSFAG